MHANNERGNVVVWVLVAIAALVAYALWWDAHRAIAHPVGVLAAAAPLQQPVADPRPIALDGFELTPLARFSLQARVLARADYRADAESALAPTDLVLGWGPMSDSAVLDQISISQSGRWYHWYAAEPPIGLDLIALSSANMHMIPANTGIAEVLARARTGHVVTIEGYLVAARKPDGWSWISSMSRSDTGSGACELVYVESMALR